jgi:FtsZ-interacting cell division protein ZipA
MMGMRFFVIVAAVVVIGILLGLWENQRRNSRE